MTNTLNWYKENAEEFISRTLTVDMTVQLENFIKYITPGAKILDLGCGAGAASLYFQNHGFDVTPVDGCPEMCEATSRLIGKEARNIMFRELDYDNEFDGVWACASLLHVPKNEMAKILTLVRNSLKSGGIFYASFKYGDTERLKNGRLFSDYTQKSLKTTLTEAGGFDIISMWITSDARPERYDEKWVNVICRKLC